MADRLYLSLWYPNFRLESLPAALAGVLRQFAQVGAKRVSAASAYPINFTEPPTYQRIYLIPPPRTSTPPSQSIPPPTPSTNSSTPPSPRPPSSSTTTWHTSSRCAGSSDPQDQEPAYSRLGFASSRDEDDAEPDLDALSPAPPGSAWRLRAHTVRILGFGPRFDVAGYEQNGHLLVDFGIDSPWVPNPPLTTPALQSPEDEALDETAQIHIQQNVEKLLAFTLLVEKNCGISSRLLWTESGKPLAEKLIARLQRVH